jgi:hypothetical protein
MLVGAAFTIQLTLILQQIKRLNENEFSALIIFRSRKLIITTILKFKNGFYKMECSDYKQKFYRKLISYIKAK